LLRQAEANVAAPNNFQVGWFDQDQRSGRAPASDAGQTLGSDTQALRDR